MTQIVLLFILMTGSVVGSAVFRKQFEELLPITNAGIVIILFLCGIVNILEIGVYVVLALCVCLWLFSAYRVLKEKNWISFLKRFLTPGFFIFVVLYFILGNLCRDMVAREWDEFSHWADIVKAMVQVNDFGTNPEAYSMFPSYPPGMALFQYFFQKIYLLLKPGQVFSEWRLFFAYQIFFISLLLPFLKNLSFKQPLKNVLVGIMIWLAPMLIFTNIYSCIYIDPILGFIGGTAFAMVFVRKDRDVLYDWYIYVSIIMLVLMKDAGMLFAVGLLLNYIMDVIYSSKSRVISDLLNKRNILRVTGGVASLILPKLLWAMEIKISQVPVAFSGKVNIVELVRILLGQEPDNYRSTVLELYSLAFMNHKIPLGESGIEIPYIALLILLLGAAYLLYWKCKDTFPQYCTIRKVCIYCMADLSVVFVLGMCISYMFKFSEGEALSLAAFSRYLRIIFHFLWIFVLSVSVYLMAEKGIKNFRIEIIVFSIIMVIVPWSQISQNVTRRTVEQQINLRSSYQTIADRIIAANEEKKDSIIVNIICLEEEWCERLVFGYTLRPYRITWNYKEGNSAEQWQEELKETTDYVALYKINESFIENFSAMFENEQDIQESAVYRVNRQTGQLILIDQ